MKKKDKCTVEWCNKLRKRTNVRGFSNYCSTHQHNATITSFLNKVYNDMKARVTGKTKKEDAKYYLGKPILPKELFILWARNHPDFLRLYKQYYMARFDIKLSPSVNRMDSKLGYTLNNMEWVTNSQNCMMAGAVRKMKNRKAIYDLLGVNNGKK